MLIVCVFFLFSFTDEFLHLKLHLNFISHFLIEKFHCLYLKIEERLLALKFFDIVPTSVHIFYELHGTGETCTFAVIFAEYY